MVITTTNDSLLYLFCEAGPAKRDYLFTRLKDENGARWKKARQHIRSEIKQLITERYKATPTEVVIQRVNEATRGWVGYFRYGNCTKAMSALRDYLLMRMRVYLRRKHRYRSFGYTRYHNRYYFASLGVYEVPTKAPRNCSANASG